MLTMVGGATGLPCSSRGRAQSRQYSGSKGSERTVWASSFKLSVSPSAGIKPVSALTQISLLIWLKVPGCVPSQKNSFLVSQGGSGGGTRPVEGQTGGG